MSLTPEEFLDASFSDAPWARLDALVRVLRGPNGCPWDQRQTASTIIDYVIDEAYELKHALGSGTPGEVVEELGDLLFTVSFLRETLIDLGGDEAAIGRVIAKMIERHPHVFKKSGLGTASEVDVKRHWEQIKASENGKARRLDADLPSSLPAWRRVAKMLTRARNAGFAFATPQDAWAKVEEEWSELKDALNQNDLKASQAELGDLVLALLTASSAEGLDAETALADAGRRFADRLDSLEQIAGSSLAQVPMEDLGPLYQQARKVRTRASFTSCGISAWDGATLNAVVRAAQNLAAHGYDAAMDLIAKRPELKESIASLVEGDSSQVVLVPNVSSAALGVAYSLDWQSGDALLLGRYEFPANTVPWKLAAKTLGVEVLSYDDDLLRRDPQQGWKDLEHQLAQGRCRLVAISAVSYWSGFRVPIKRLASLCRAYGALLFVDGVQAAGATPLSMADGIDFLACGSHKTLMAPEGAGFLCFSSRGGQHWVPRVGSWLSLPDPLTFLHSNLPTDDPYEKDARLGDPTVLEGGSLSALGYVGLAASLRELLERGIEIIYQKVQELQDPLEEGLVSLGFRSLRSADLKCRSTILAFDPPPGVDALSLQEALGRLGVGVTSPRGRIRFGFHHTLDREDVELALKQVRLILAR